MALDLTGPRPNAELRNSPPGNATLASILACLKEVRLPQSEPIRYVFLLLPGFSPLGFTCAQEALGLANRFADGQRFYDWMLISEDGAPVEAWNGLRVNVDAGLIDLDRRDKLIVCAGESAVEGSSRKVLGWLRRETRKGVEFGALSSGTHLLAEAGLLSGKRVTTHWEYSAAASERYHDVTFQDSIFAVDGQIFTCAGGASSMDLMLYRIHADYGAEMATWVADQMVYTEPRGDDHAQRVSLAGREGVRHSKLLTAIGRMRENLEEPLPPREIAAELGISSRQLERLFAKYLNSSPSRYYLALRLEKARQLIMQTELSQTEIAIICGFKSLTHFSRTYRKFYGAPPSRDTGTTFLLFAGR